LRRDGDNNDDDDDDDDEATAASLLLDRVRRKVRAVAACNVFLPNPLATASEAASTVDVHTAVSIKSSSVVPPSTLETNSLFDVIISTLSLEFASVTVKDYSLAVANVASLLKPNGHLILQVFKI